MHSGLRKPTDLNEIVAAPASNLNSPGGGEYWDPVSDTYRSKRTNDRVPDEIIQEENTPEGYKTDSSVEISSALGVNPDLWEYWDPISDSYKNKKSSKNIPENGEQRGILKSSLDSSLERNEDPAVGCWEYWDRYLIHTRVRSPVRISQIKVNKEEFQSQVLTPVLEKLGIQQ